MRNTSVKSVIFSTAIVVATTFAMAGESDFSEYNATGLPKTTKLNADYSSLKQSRAVPLLSAFSQVQSFKDKGSTVRGAAEASIFQKVARGTVLIATDSGLGSGAVLTNAGHILTNKHVVGDAQEVKVFFYPANAPGDLRKAVETNGTVYKVNDYNDLALVKVSKMPTYVRPIPLRTSGVPSVGEDAHAVGHPKGEPWTYTRGYVSQVRNSYEWQTDENGVKHKADVVQTQTPINPGNSGGPLVSDMGELIGINSFGNPSAPGMNYAVATSTVMTFLKQEGSVRAEKPKKKVTKNCGKEPVGDERVTLKSGPALKIYYDPDCVGHPTMVLTIPDDESKAIVMIVEHPDHPGATGILVADFDRDGDFDYTLVDEDGDGRWDLEGDNKPGEVFASAVRRYKS